MTNKTVWKQKYNAADSGNRIASIDAQLAAKEQRIPGLSRVYLQTRDLDFALNEIRKQVNPAPHSES